MTQEAPRLTFACELDAARLQALFEDQAVIDALVALQAGVALGLLDLGPERAAVTQQLTRVGIPLTAWLLLPQDQGYWFNADNAAHATARYDQFKAWTAQYGLEWAAVGLDVEPDINELGQLMQGQVDLLLPRWLSRLGDGERIRRARQAYGELVDRIRRDGYLVETYQFPFIADERRVGAELLQRLLGILDLHSDREVFMLYTSIMPAVGPGLLASYGPEAQVIGVGSTGGGIELAGHAPVPALTWEQFARDLRLARHWRDSIFIFSLEGCVAQGFLQQLHDFDWNRPEAVPTAQLRRVEGARKAFRGLLWASAHPWQVLAGSLAALWLLSRLVRRSARDES